MSGRRYWLPRCGAMTRKGTACKRKPILNPDGSIRNRRCRNHSGLATGPRTAAGHARCLAGRLELYRRRRAAGLPAPRRPQAESRTHGLYRVASSLSGRERLRSPGAGDRRPSPPVSGQGVLNATDRKMLHRTTSPSLRLCLFYLHSILPTDRKAHIFRSVADLDFQWFITRLSTAARAALEAIRDARQGRPWPLPPP
jgi:hypothetical protein